MTRITSESVRAAFQDAGIRNQQQLTLAESATSRIQDLADIGPARGKWSDEQRDAIGNLFGFIRDRVFKASDTPVHQANTATYQALNKLGLGDTVRQAGAATLDRLGLDIDHQDYRAIVKDVASLAGRRSNDNGMRKLARAEDLDITSISWDDTGRVGTNSPWGENIVDSSISVVTSDARTGQSESHLMPIIRRPNMEDVTADIDMENFMIKVGNARGEEPRQISLKEALLRPWELMTNPEKWPLLGPSGEKVGVYAPGTDEQALVAAQSSLLPVSRKGGQATFLPAAYSYTSYQHREHGPQPTVLNLMVTREGTSMEILGDDTAQGRFGSGADQLHFNANGQRAPLTAERAKQVAAEGGNIDFSGAGQGNADQANRILFIQVPLTPEHPRQPRRIAFALSSTATRGGGGDLDDAVIGHGTTEGPFDEELGKGWSRNPGLPVRVTVQFAKTLADPSSLNGEAFKSMRQEIDAVYENASRVGSLVMTGDKNTTIPWLPGPPVTIPTPV